MDVFVSLVYVVEVMINLYWRPPVVWGYNSSGDGQAGGPSTSVAADVPESDETSTTTTTNQKDVVSNRVAGLTQKMVMREHKDAITSVFCARYNDEDYLVSRNVAFIEINLETGSR